MAGELRRPSSGAEKAGRSAARRRTRPGHPLGALLLAGGIALGLGCGPSELARGVWLSAAEGRERYALTFDYTGRVMITGTMHLLEEGKLVSEWGFAGTRTGDGGLQVGWADDGSITATVDPEAGELRATVRLAEGSVFQGLFRRTAAAEIPGFEARPGGTYRLRPTAAGSGWEVADPAAAGLDPDHLEATVEAVIRGEAGLLHSLVIVRRGRLVLEEYFHGFARDDLHGLESATRSIASLLVGIARDRGEIGGLDTAVLEWFPEHAATAESGWPRVTLEHLLTLTAGLDWDRWDLRGAPEPGPGLFARAFQRRVVHEPGTRWLDNGLDVELLGGILRRATGMQADELAARTLFAPLGITAWDWEAGKSEGYPSLAGTLRLRPLDMAKIGQLVLDGGRWLGEPVVSEEWIAEATRIAPGLEAQRYGYLWTRAGPPPEAGLGPVIVAPGSGSQLIHVLPELEAVVVTTGGNYANYKSFAIGGVLVRYLVPGVLDLR